MCLNHSCFPSTKNSTLATRIRCSRGSSSLASFSRAPGLSPMRCAQLYLTASGWLEDWMAPLTGSLMRWRLKGPCACEQTSTVPRMYKTKHILDTMTLVWFKDSTSPWTSAEGSSAVGATGGAGGGARGASWSAQ